MIEDYLGTGAGSAITGAEICYRLGIDARTLRKEVELARRDGQPICSNTGKNPGYYLAATREEMAAFCRTMERRNRAYNKTLKACRATLEALPATEEAQQ